MIYADFLLFYEVLPFHPERLVHNAETITKNVEKGSK